jgi:hypothetical protein
MYLVRSATNIYFLQSHILDADLGENIDRYCIKTDIPVLLSKKQKQNKQAKKNQKTINYNIRSEYKKNTYTTVCGQKYCNM